MDEIRITKAEETLEALASDLGCEERIRDQLREGVRQDLAGAA